MKIVLAHNRYSSAIPSGENTVVETESELLAGAGVEVIQFIRSSDEIAQMSVGQRLALPVSPVYAHGAQQELAALLSRARPDLLHLHNPYPLLSPWVVRTAQQHGVPVVQTVHNYRHVCVAGTFFRDGKPCQDCVGRSWATPAVVHGCYRGSRAQSAIMATALAFHRGTWKRVDRFLALTEQMAAFLRQTGIPDERIAIKPNSVPDPGQPDAGGEGFLFAGRLSSEKGIDLLLDAWRTVPDGTLGRLTIAGDGPLRPLVQALAGTRSDLAYVGRLDPVQMGRAISAAAVVVTPSTCDDVSPVVAVEAMAHGRPVLATDVGGLPWLLGAAANGSGAQPADGGWVVQPTVRALAEGLEAARAADPSRGRQARRRYEDHFSPKVTTARLVEIYRDVLAVDAHRSA